MNAVPDAADLVFRRAEAADAPGMAEVWLRAFAAALSTVRRAHDDDEVRDWFSAVVVPDCEAWVAVHEDSVSRKAVIGILVLEDAELEQLYLEPSWRGCGVGDRFIALAKRLRPQGLGLWTFEVNQPARLFHERHGFLAVQRTDGSRNAEGEPDVRLVWRPAEIAAR
ncbi:GNAT family N-acetyltransferase [Sciscionella marina]|uniref:GNAT family N-acetyltransferase n=1 Tax=Sciscionella marina TaxID=508770 RepID=UPI000A036C61|nr:GNAT family N-acetyltransferase [Sciscionella marina]